MSHYANLFRNINGFAPYHWQEQLAADTLCTNRLIRILTGLGKTEGVTKATIGTRASRTAKGDDR
jgi:ERCC4-related helicase